MSINSSTHPMLDVVDNFGRVAALYGIDASEEVESLRNKIHERQMEQLKSDMESMELENRDEKGNCAHTVEEIPVFAGLVLSEEFECSVCKLLLCEPVTISCGHTFCRDCLSQSLTKTKKECPECRSPCHVDAKNTPVSFTLLKTLESHFGTLYDSRLEEVAKRTNKGLDQISVFFMLQAHMTYTSMKLFLFEPRYQIMIRRALEGNKVFGYVCKHHENRVQRGDIGVKAHIVCVAFLADGKCVVDVVFGHRFRVENEWIEDGTFGLWQCEKVDVADEVMSHNELASAELLANYTVVKDFVVKTRLKSIDQRPPIVDLGREPARPKWLLESPVNWPALGTEKELSLRVSKWTLWVSGLVRHEYEHAVGHDEAATLALSLNTPERMRMLARVCRSAQIISN